MTWAASLKLSKDKNFENMQKAMYGQFENTFMMYLPRLCCLNPACVATCPSGAIYKREEDGIVLIDQDKCRGWRVHHRLPVQENLLQLEER
jgi:nitrate reductase beta subunit